jgi:trimethylamine--corrinoid protein Co-methyltransferase
MIANFATVLTAEQVQRIHEASLEILEDVGLLVRNARARDILTQHGCSIDTETNNVRLPRPIVREFRASFPSKFTFYGRDPRFDRTIPGDRPLIMTASSAPNIIDPLTGRERRGTSEDMARITHLFNELPALDIFSVSILCDDAPDGHFSLSRYYPALKNTMKPVRGNVPDVEEAEKVIRLGAILAGGEEAYRERPLITHHYCAVVSPLTLDFDSTELLIHLTEKGLPGYATIVPNAGLTSPLTLLGTIAQGNAEFLAWATLKQMIRPGAELIYSALPTVGDMRTGAYAPGGIETGIMGMAFAQMARYYDVPSAGYMGLTNAKAVDAQAGYEKGMSPMAGFLGGLDMINMAGLIDALMAFDYGMMVIDNEIAEMIKRFHRGLEFSEENVALDVIAEAGAAGMFLDQPHTLERMKRCAILPTVADRDPRRTWQENGALDAKGRAMKRVREILTHDNLAVFSADVDAHIRSQFEGLVAGDSIPPPGWKPPAPARTRKRRNKRRG